MVAIARVVTEFFMMVLCVSSAPVDQQEIVIDVVGDRGYLDTMIVRREEDGFAVYDEMNGELVKGMTVVPKKGAENTFVCKLVHTEREGKSETVYLNKAIEGFNVADLRTKKRLRLKTIDGVNIAVDRSRDVVFITPDKLKRTYVVH